jgi:succinyl-CoA synthetase alpha subunit
MFTVETKAIFFGEHHDPLQRMLDYDFLCRREPSVVALVNPNREGWHKVFWGKKEIVIPVYRHLSAAPPAEVLINFASARSAVPVVMEGLKQNRFKCMVVVAEGIRERDTRLMAVEAKKKRVMVIGPATVGGLRAGCFRIGNTGGSIENIVAAKLYRPGSVGLVSRSGGMLNELFNIIAQETDGVVEGIQIGGDRFPATGFMDHLLRFEEDEAIKMHVCLGEVGGGDEIKIAEAIEKGQIKKPVVFWAIGTSAEVFKHEVQFGHAGALKLTDEQSARFKNRRLQEAGADVPKSFNDFGKMIGRVYQKLKLKPVKEVAPQLFPTGRRETHIVSTISDDRGEEPTYKGKAISTIVQEKVGVGGVIGLLWFKKELPELARRYLELVLVLVADHGPAVAGAINAIVAARAGKDAISALTSGLLTIGPRFGGAIDDAARTWYRGRQEKLSAFELVEEMKRQGEYIPGIGHRVKSKSNPDKRVEILKEFSRKYFKKQEYLDYAVEIEGMTTKKKENLILNVDGAIGATALDLLVELGYNQKEMAEFLAVGYLNGLFALGRSIGLLGHVFDQKRLKEPLYRHPTDDIFYAPSPEATEARSKND